MWHLVSRGTSTEILMKNANGSQNTQVSLSCKVVKFNILYIYYLIEFLAAIFY